MNTSIFYFAIKSDFLDEPTTDTKTDLSSAAHLSHDRPHTQPNNKHFGSYQPRKVENELKGHYREHSLTS